MQTMLFQLHHHSDLTPSKIFRDVLSTVVHYSEDPLFWRSKH